MKNKAFTLLELLVVISIIALLAGLLMPALAGARTAAKKAQAKMGADSIQVAILAFRNEYGTYPPVNGYQNDVALNHSQQSDLFKILMGDSSIADVNGASCNPRGLKFLEWSGSITNTVMLDPWNHEYQVVMDYDFDSTINILPATPITANVAVYSFGANGVKTNLTDWVKTWN